MLVGVVGNSRSWWRPLSRTEGGCEGVRLEGNERDDLLPRAKEETKRTRKAGE